MGYDEIKYKLKGEKIAHENLISIETIEGKDQS